MILVTGGTGLVGSHLLYQLTMKYDAITAIYRKSSDLNVVKHIFSYYTDAIDLYFNKINWVEADILDVTSLDKAFDAIDYVYHCAALVSFNATDAEEMKKVNIEGTANIVNLSMIKGIKKICHVSSIAAVGKSQNGEEINEAHEWNIENSNYDYAITKHGAEMEVWRASQEGVPVVIVNPGVILGSGFWNSGTGKLFSSVSKGLKFYTEGVTGFVGVRDVVTIMISLMKSDISNERFILVSENISFKDILYTIADHLNKKRPSIKITPLISALFWRIEWLLKLLGRKPLLTRRSAKSSHKKYYYSNLKIKERLGYDFEPMENVIASISKDFTEDLF